MRDGTARQCVEKVRELVDEPMPQRAKRGGVHRKGRAPRRIHQLTNSLTHQFTNSQLLLFAFLAPFVFGLGPPLNVMT